MNIGRLRVVMLAITLACLSAGAFAYDFWGISMGTQTYAGSTQLTFDGVAATNAQFAVGAYKYTRVDSSWYGPFAAASPGASYAVHRKVDAQAIFFRPDASGARFMIIAGTPQTGITAPECGYGSRVFGPGDLKIDTSDGTYGIGLRLSGLLWAVDPSTTDPKYKIYKATGGTDSIYARDAGTLGRVELNPRWSHTDNSSLPANDPAGFAFFVKATGSLVGGASVAFYDTGISLYGAGVYAYEVTVPWSVIGLSQSNYNFMASWRPDCGNDWIGGAFSAESYFVPEPGGLLAIATGVIGLLARCRRRQ